ncbi:MAG TPA: IPT/TIG domain-containing protein, partial [Polyangiaceae bacterium]
MRLRRGLNIWGAAFAGVGGVALTSCLPRSDKPLTRQTDDDAGILDPSQLGGDAGDERRDLPDAAPHAVLGVDPPHGPFAGGQLATVRGNGFQSNVRVWFGDELVPEEDTLAVDPTRIQVTVPGGASGLVDVVAQNGDDTSTRALLVDAYHYDSFYVAPASGPTSGGTVLTLHGDGTDWDDATTVLVDLEPCEIEAATSPTELTCRTPPGTPGAKPVRVVAGDTETDVLDAFIYGDSENGFRGGLSGERLDGELTVSVLDNFLGQVIPGATVILGDTLEDADMGRTGARGSITFDGIDAPRSVTVSAPCFQPATFVDVEVDTVTAYLDPVLSPECAPPDIGELPGGTSVTGSRITGELVWPQREEFGRDGWTNVPQTQSADEARVAYVFRLSSNPTGEFSLPSAIGAVTPSSPGEAGFSFSLTSLPGNVTVYALAGIENRSFSPPVFDAYAMGLVRGIAAEPAATTENIFIRIDTPLDHALTLRTTGPASTPRGPDRLLGAVAIRVSDQGYVILPGARKSALLPGERSFDFVGLPSLSGTLGGTEYVVSAAAVTGLGEALPISFLGLFATTTNEPIDLDEFVEIPSLV